MPFKKYGKNGDPLSVKTYGHGGLLLNVKSYDLQSVIGEILESMKLNTNINWIASWESTVHLANVLKGGQGWVQKTGSGAFTSSRGTLTPTVGTDEFFNKLSDDGAGMPAGEYTLLNPGGHELAVGDFTVATAYQAYTTATEVTFTYNGASDGLLALWAKGNVNDIGTAVIIPGHLASYQAGDIWNSEFISYLSGMNITAFRSMDLNVASDNYETNWADRRLTTHITSGAVMPWEYVLDLANKLSIEPWLCIPTRATDAYAASMAQLIAANYTGNFYLELGNEIWNSGAPWGDGTSWISWLDNPRYDIIPLEATNEFTWTAHGLSNNDFIRSYSTELNRGATVDFQLKRGAGSYVSVIDVNTIQLLREPSGSVIPIDASQVDAVVIIESEGTSDINIHYGERSVAIWDVFETYLSPSKVKKVIAVQSAGSNTTTQRFNATGVSGRADYVSPAPYYYGLWWGAQIDLTTTVATPKIWVNDAGYTIYCGCYANGSTPSNAEIIAGTGTGYIASSSVSSDATSSYVSFTPVTGLVDTTDYEMFFVMTEGANYQWRLEVPFTQAASGSVEGHDSYANQALRNRISVNTRTAIIPTHITESDNTPLIVYEGGIHFDESAPTAVGDWRDAYGQSSEFNDTNEFYLRTLAALDVEQYFHYKDISEGGVWGYAGAYDDITDPRYVARIALGGTITKSIQVSYENEVTEQLTDPGSFPHVIHTFSDSSLTYSIVGGDYDSRYDINGLDFRMISDAGVDWGTPSTADVIIEATDGLTSDFVTLNVALGDAWYAGDAYFAFDSIDDTDNGVMNPVLGANAPLTVGTGATIASGLWDMLDANVYDSSSQSPNVNAALPWMIEWVIDLDGQTAAGDLSKIHLGGSANVRLVVDAGALKMIVYHADTGNKYFNIGLVSSYPAGTKFAVWIYYDANVTTPTITAGYNQTEVVDNTVDLSNSSLGLHRITVGSDGAVPESDAKHGSLMCLSRAELTLTQAKALVQKLQDHHGIT